MALSEAQRRANDKYIKEKYERLPLSYPKEFCEQVRARAGACNESIAGYVKKAIEKRFEEEDKAAQAAGSHDKE